MPFVGFAILLAVVNAYCVVNCVVSPCETANSFEDRTTEPPCHHKTPQPHGSNENPTCSHHFLATADGLASGHVSHEGVQVAMVEIIIGPVLVTSMQSTLADFHSPPIPDLARNAILRI
jgi:hypothetical protein